MHGAERGREWNPFLNRAKHLPTFERTNRKVTERGEGERGESVGSKRGKENKMTYWGVFVPFLGQTYDSRSLESASTTFLSLL